MAWQELSRLCLVTAAGPKMINWAGPPGFWEQRPGQGEAVVRWAGWRPQGHPRQGLVGVTYPLWAIFIKGDSPTCLRWLRTIERLLYKVPATDPQEDEDSSAWDTICRRDPGSSEEKTRRKWNPWVLDGDRTEPAWCSRTVHLRMGLAVGGDPAWERTLFSGPRLPGTGPEGRPLAGLPQP